MKLPPGPRSAFWQTLRYLRDPLGSMATVAAKYGDPFTFPGMGGKHLVCTGSPEGVKAIFGADPDTFSPFAAEGMAPILGRGSILIQHGSPHRRSRKLMTPPFHGARMRAYGAKMGEVTERHLRQAPKGRFDIEQIFRNISLEVILETVFGVGGSQVDGARQTVLGAIAAFNPLLAMFAFLRKEFFPPWARFRKMLGQVHGLLEGQIAARQKEGPGEDICGLLVAARDEEGRPMDDQEIVEQLFTMVVAGHETTSTALAFAVDELWRSPEWLARLKDQLAPTGGDPDKLAADKTLDAVCAETLRLRPLVPAVSRYLQKPLELGGYSLPAGVGVAACLALAHRRPEVYPEPEAFRPERFLDGKSFSPQEYFPWGGGNRRCLGAAFAMYEMKIVLGKLVLAGTLELASPLRAKVGTRAATIGPRGGVKVVYSPAP